MGNGSTAVVESKVYLNGQPATTILPERDKEKSSSPNHTRFASIRCSFLFFFCFGSPLHSFLVVCSLVRSICVRATVGVPFPSPFYPHSPTRVNRSRLVPLLLSLPSLSAFCLVLKHVVYVYACTCNGALSLSLKSAAQPRCRLSLPPSLVFHNIHFPTHPLSQTTPTSCYV